MKESYKDCYAFVVAFYSDSSECTMFVSETHTEKYFDAANDNRYKLKITTLILTRNDNNINLDEK